jgi:putative transposase
MRAKRYSAEQIVAKLREAEKLQAQGLTIPAVV